MADRSVALIVGANRGIGLGVVREFLSRGWTVVTTARHPAQARDLSALAARHPGQVEIVPLDVNDSAQLDSFVKAMKGRTLDVVLINAGVAGPSHCSAKAATIAEIGALMYTNAIAPIRLAQDLLDDIRPGSGVLAFTSSAMGSVSLNTGGHELYRASKAALNSLTRGLASNPGGRSIAVLSLHPGWVRTDMGGASAPVTVEVSARGLVDVIEKAQGSQRHAFIDYTGKEIAW
jgi:NAD(P)-dependent dehydrogenase (short-subunit alcohol dehydrogenase family)